MDRVELEAIFMRSASSERGPADPNGESFLETEARVLWDWAGPARLVYIVELMFDVVDSESMPKLTGSVEYAACYHVSADYQPSPGELEFFSLHGVAFQLHPYLREHVADVCIRSGIAPVMLPILLRETSSESYSQVSD